MQILGLYEAIESIAGGQNPKLGSARLQLDLSRTAETLRILVGEGAQATSWLQAPSGAQLQMQRAMQLVPRFRSSNSLPQFWVSGREKLQNSQKPLKHQRELLHNGCSGFNR